MHRIRVLIVDDAVVVRRLLAHVLEDDPELEVVGTAANGKIALAKIAQSPPDVVTLDVEMPEMSGLETLAEIRRRWPRLPVVMFSTVTERGAAATLEALALGATDYATKPTQVGGVDQAKHRIREQLVPKLKTFGAPRPMAFVPRAAPVPSGRVAASAAPPRSAAPVAVLAIGVSTGGPNALATVLSALPPYLPVPILIVQHMPPVFTKLLAERLATRCAFPVREAVAGARLQPGEAWLAPGDHHMTVVRAGTAVEIGLDQGAPQNSCRPSVDPLFRSVAAVYGPGTLAVVLTGMGHDGLRGCELVHERGGRILVQDAASSVVWGMPGAVAEAGLAELVVPLGDVAVEILRRVRDPGGGPVARRDARTERPAVGRP